MSKYVVSTFYKFVSLPHYKELRTKILAFCKKEGMLGTILLADEGVNSTIVAPRETMDKFYAFMRNIKEFTDIEYNETLSEVMPFKRMKVRLKQEIVRIKTDVNISNTATHLSADDWDEIMDKNEDTVVIDTRNIFEIGFGTFKNSIHPETFHFSDFVEWAKENAPKYKDKKVLMCCTGGIRCEKATVVMKEFGCDNVFQLKGGIIQYLKETKSPDNWQGKCFVFDDRIALDRNLKPHI